MCGSYTHAGRYTDVVVGFCGNSIKCIDSQCCRVQDRHLRGEVGKQLMER